MERLTQQQLRALLEFVRECYACLDRGAFVAHLLRALPKIIPSESISYNEVNSNSGQFHVAMEPSSVRFSEDEQIFMRHMSDHPLITHYKQTRDGQALKISDFLTQHQFHRLGLYKEFYRRLGVEYQMAALLAVSPPLRIAIAFNRSRRDFSERERLLLDLVRPHLTQAYENTEALTQIRQEGALLGQAVEAGSRGVVVLTREGQIRLISLRAREWLGGYFGRVPLRATRLPEPLRSFITHGDALLGRADDVPSPRKPLRVERDGKRLVVRHLDDAEQCVLLLEERQTALQSASAEPFGLTRREAEVLYWVAQGKTNAEIGIILGVRPRTVQKHLEHIFEKLGVESRTAAAAALAFSRRSGA